MQLRDLRRKLGFRAREKPVLGVEKPIRIPLSRQVLNLHQALVSLLTKPADFRKEAKRVKIQMSRATAEATRKGSGASNCCGENPLTRTYAPQPTQSIKALSRASGADFSAQDSDIDAQSEVRKGHADLQ